MSVEPEPSGLCFEPAVHIAARLRSGDLSAREIVGDFLQRIEKRDPELNAYITVLADSALEAARRADEALARGDEVGPLHGVPIAIKDLYDFKSKVPNTFGSRLFADFVPDSDATDIARLESAGAIVLGKTNVPEFGHKGTTDNTLIGPTSTPFAIGKNAGGSSGGSAAAVADGLAAVAQASDAGGSIRIPAAWCGVYGYKATFGVVPRAARPNAFKHAPLATSGVVARTVGDAALLLSVMAGGWDPRDPFSVPAEPVDWAGAAASGDLTGLRIAYSPDFGGYPIDSRVATVVEDAVRAFAEGGADIETVDLVLPCSPQEHCDIWLRQTASSNLDLLGLFKARGIDILGSQRDSFAPEFVALLDRGLSLSTDEVLRDRVMRTRIFDALELCLGRYDLLLTPTVAVPPVDNAASGRTLGPTEINGVSVDPTIGWCLTYPLNLTGHPAASLPAGLTPEGLPVGLQIIGRRYSDATVLAASAAFELIRPWSHVYPGLSGAAISGRHQVGRRQTGEGR
ncbi:amidase [Streptomyces sp. NBC_01352]|uniref:amidase n=1 Tax=Streptomyces sp. NBC_01352 TaxID=2903834 RepID=UPI002E325C8A|nr:amidase [Streptomyces sp. NBC_01352]